MQPRAGNPNRFTHNRTQVHMASHPRDTFVPLAVLVAWSHHCVALPCVMLSRLSLTPRIRANIVMQGTLALIHHCPPPCHTILSFSTSMSCLGATMCQLPFTALASAGVLCIAEGASFYGSQPSASLPLHWQGGPRIICHSAPNGWYPTQHAVRTHNYRPH